LGPFACLSFRAMGVLLTACQTPGASGGVAERAPLAVPDSTTDTAKGIDRISPMDLLDISVFGAPDLDNTYQVDFEGRLKMPLVGTVSAFGYTAAELSRLLESRLGEKYLQNPEVFVRIMETRERLITVDGAVEKPGMYPIEEQITLLQAVALSGGPDDSANPKRVVIFRQIDGERHAGAFNLIDIRKGEAEDPLIYTNDIIVVDGSEARRAYGDILRTVPLIGLFIYPYR